MDNIKVLMSAIKTMLNTNLAITEMDLTRQFIFGEDLKELAELKAACYKLEEKGELILMYDMKGEMVLLNKDVVEH